jgi:hypothetical protein
LCNIHTLNNRRRAVDRVEVPREPKQIRYGTGVPSLSLHLRVNLDERLNAIRGEFVLQDKETWGFGTRDELDERCLYGRWCECRVWVRKLPIGGVLIPDYASEAENLFGYSANSVVGISIRRSTGFREQI